MVNFCPLNSFRLPGLNVEGPSSFSLDNEISVLASSGLSSSVFSHVGEGPFSEMYRCNPAQNTSFRNYSSLLGSRIGRLTSAELEQRVSTLYHQAYSYDAARREMVVSNPNAKNRLDLYIALIEREAFANAPFGNHLTTVLIDFSTLSQSALNPRHGAWHHLLQTHQASLGEYYAELASQAVNGNVRPQDIRSLYHLEEVLQLGSRSPIQEAGVFPLEEITRALGEGAFFESFQNLSHLSDRDLASRLRDLNYMMGLEDMRPDLVSNICREILLCVLEIHRRGLQFKGVRLQGEAMQLNRTSGLSVGDLEMVIGARVMNAPLMRAVFRHRALDRYRELYRQALLQFSSGHLEDALANDVTATSRYLFNNAFSDLELTTEDLRRIRREVQTELRLQTRGNISFEQLQNMQPTDTLFLRPQELGVSSSDAFRCLDEFNVEGESLRSYIERTVDFIAIGPDLSSHVAATTFSLFGIFYLSNNLNQPAELLAPNLAHESGHVRWLMDNFDQHPERFQWHGVDERGRYLQSRDVLMQAYARTNPDANALSSPGSLLRQQLAVDLSFVNRIIRAANSRLQIDREDFDPNVERESWRLAETMQLDFQPADLISDEGENQLGTQRYSTIPEGERLHWNTQFWDRWSRSEILHFDESEKQELFRTLEELQNLPNDRVYRTLPATHPFLRVFNEIYRQEGRARYPNMTLTLNMWNYYARTAVALAQARVTEAADYERVFLGREDLIEESLLQCAVGMAHIPVEELPELRRQFALAQALRQRDETNPDALLVLPENSPLARFIKRFDSHALIESGSLKLYWKSWLGMLSTVVRVMDVQTCTLPRS